MSILTNAVDSLAMGIEDFKSKEQRRLVSCTRNICAGILLLFKHKLVELSPSGSDEVLIKQRIIPVRVKGRLRWSGSGRKTVDVLQIKERFDSLGVQVDWKRVTQIIDHRNDIEHYYGSLSHDAVRNLIASSFIVIRDFVRTELKLDPLSLLGKETWDSLTTVAEVHDKEKAECDKHIGSVDWLYDCVRSALEEWNCSACGSDLINVEVNGTRRTDAKFDCLSCGLTWNFDEGVEAAINQYFAGENYRSVKDGGDPENVTCPECNRDTLILVLNVCVICETTPDWICKRCSAHIPAVEIGYLDGFCSWCAHMMSKDD